MIFTINKIINTKIMIINYVSNYLISMVLTGKHTINKYKIKNSKNN